MSIRDIHSCARLGSVRTLAIACLLLAGCSETFKPASYVDRLRVLAIRADVPEVAPPARGDGGVELDPQPEGHPSDRSRIRALIADPAQLEDPTREVTVLYLACTPDPELPFAAAACTSFEVLGDPRALAALLGEGVGGGGASCGGDDPGSEPRSPVSFLGAETCRHGQPCKPIELEIEGSSFELPPPTYVVPEELRLDELPPTAPSRILGLQVSVLAIAVAASPQELLDGADPSDPCTVGSTLASRVVDLIDERDSVTAVKRLQIRGPDAADAPNLNPVIAGISSGGTALPEVLEDPVQAEALVRKGREYGLRSILPDGAENLVQAYTRYDVFGGKVGDEKEEWLYSWFATAGNLDELRRRVPDDPNRWTAPTGKDDDPVPESGRIFLYVVVRDLRGGIDWTMREVRLEGSGG